MNKPLSERLAELEFRAACPGMKEVWLPMYPTELAALIHEALALARRVEGAQERTVVQDREGFLYVGAMKAGLDFRQRVRLVPEVGS